MIFYKIYDIISLVIKMESSLDYKKVDDYLKQKLEKNSDIIICYYFEIKTKVGVLKKDENLFLRYARDRLEEQGYDCYFTNAKYKYNNQEKIVESNESIVAIKNKY